ncbi:hypothetical protein JCM11491_001655 [Sporobolomyces phaffii]
MPALPPPTGHAIPTAFHVATSTAPRTNDSQEAALYDSFESQAASRALSTVTSLKVKLEWIETLSAPGVPLATLKESLDFLDATSWDDLVVERHLEGLCPYPTCSKSASTPYVEREEDEVERKFKLHGGALYDAGPRSAAGRDRGPYCSVKCRARSDWVKAVLGKEGRRELLEDVEERRQRVKQSTEELVRERDNVTVPESIQGVAPSDKDAFKTDLLSSLTIREKETTSSSPVAPSLQSASIDFERPIQSSDTHPKNSRFPLDPNSSSSSKIKSLSNTSSALLPFTTTSLGRTILASSRRSTPGNPLPVPAARQPRVGINGLPPVRFLSEPRMIDEKGREIEWADDDELDGEEAELVRGLMDEALEVRRMVEKGEL